MTDTLQEWILHYESGRIFFNRLSSDVTKRIYLSHFKRYCQAVKKTPDELIQLKIEGLKHLGEPSEYQAENMLETYLATSPMTANMKVHTKTAVMSFYAKNRRRLDPETAANIERNEPQKRCPKTKDVVEMENAMPTQRDKAVLWFIASAPIRDGSVPKLFWRDLKPTHDKEVPYYLRIEGSRLKGAGKGKYKGVKQIAFLHSLAVRKLKSYRIEAKKRGYNLTRDSPIFISYRQQGEIKPLSAYSIHGIFAKASFAAWHDLEKKRFSPQDLRDYVQSAMENAGVNRNIISPILAHKVKGVDKHYSEHDIKDFLENFKKALPYLLPQSIEKIKAESEEQAQKIAQLEKDVEALESEMIRKTFQNTFESTVESTLHAIEVVELENMLKRLIELKSSEVSAGESKTSKKKKKTEH